MVCGKRKNAEDDDDAPNSLPSKMSPRNFHHMLGKLNPHQLQAIDEIGFGSMKSLKVKDLPRNLGRYLVDRFEYCSHSLLLQSGSMVIDEDDMYCTLGLPRGELDVVEATTNKQKSKESYVSFANSFKVRWSQTQIVTKKVQEKPKGKEKEKYDNWPFTNIMCKALEERDDFGDEFKVDFIVCLVSSLIKGQQNYHCNSKVLYSLMDVGKIKDLNWCKYTYHSLLSSVEDWRKSNAKAGNYFKGPLLFLLLCYVDRLEFKVREVVRKLPILSCWTNEDLRKRVAKEAKEGFGRGHIVDRMQLFATQTLVLNEVIESHQLKVSSGRLCDGLKMIGDGMLKAARVLAEGEEVPLGQEISDKANDTFNVIGELFDSCSSLSQDSEFWERPEVLSALDHAMNCALLAKDIATIDNDSPKQNVPAKDKNAIPTSPTFSLGRDHSQSPIVTTPPSQPQQISNEDIDASIFEDDSDRDDDHSLVIGERSRRCVKNVSKYLRSPYWNKYGDLLCDVKEKERIVSDYCFLDSKELDHGEILFSYKHVYGSREDMFSLSIGQHVLCGVIDIWSLILNIQNLHRGEDKPHRVFFSTAPFYYLVKKDVSRQQKVDDKVDAFVKILKKELKLYSNPCMQDVDLVFFPIWDVNHYYVVVYNFLKEEIQYIDNRTMPSKTSFSKHYGNNHELLDVSFQKFLGEIKHSKALKFQTKIQNY